MKRERIFINCGVFAVLLLIFIAAVFAGVSSHASAEASSAEDYTFETVPVESIDITVDKNLTEVQPRQAFSVSYEVNSWYTTTKEVYFNIYPKNSAVVDSVSAVELKDGKAVGNAVITVSPDAEVGSTFSVIAGADGIESTPVEMTVAKIPVKDITLSLQGSDDKLHIGKTRIVNCEFFPAYASDLSLRYDLSGSGMKYIEDFDETTGVIKAKKDISFIDVNSTVTITAYSLDNPNAYDSVTLTLYMPTTVVEIFADTPLGRSNSDGEALAVASSAVADTVNLRATVNGVESTGLNYVIVKGQEYVEDGYVRSDGSFALRPTADWSENMKKPHPEVKIRAAYSDGFDEITIALYIPVESISFVSAVTDKVENFRSYNMQAEAFPKYATLLADNTVPIYYSLGGIDSSVAAVDSDGLLTLPKSLTSKGSIIGYSANLTNAWEGVDVQPLTYNLTVVPVYADAFKSVEITKDGLALDDENIKAIPSDVLEVAVVYNLDNVTDIDITLSENSNIVAASGNTLTISALGDMEEDNPFIEITVNYNHGGNTFSHKCYLSVYVPALSAEIADAAFQRDVPLDLNSLITINGHGYATNKNIEWGELRVLNGKSGISAECDGGFLSVSTCANAGTIVRVPYKTFDSDVWQYKEFTVAALDGAFSLEYSQTKGKGGRLYDVNYADPQLEEGQSVDIVLKYKGFGGKTNYGLTYSVDVSSNATLVYSGGETKYDKFTLGAKSGQSGRNNFVTYVITVHDGTQTYYIYTEGAAAPNGKSKLALKDFSVFKRVSGNLGVSQASIEEGESFDLTGWDSSFTYNKEDLVWTISGGRMEGNKIKSAPNRGFTLTITANQKYNGQDISFYSEVSFSAIVYYEWNDWLVKSVYKRQGCSINIAGALDDWFSCVHTGWSNTLNGTKDYEFNEVYSGSQDKTLYAYYVETKTTVKISETLSVDENQNQNIYTYYDNSDFSIRELKELGYKQIKIDFSYSLKKIKQNGDCAKIWLELNGENVFVKDRFSLESTQETYSDKFTIDIDKLIDRQQFRVGLFAYGDWKIGKYTFEFYYANIEMTATK